MKVDMKEARKSLVIGVFFLAVIILCAVTIQMARSAEMPVLLLTRVCEGGSMAGGPHSAECQVSTQGVVVSDARGNVEKRAHLNGALKLQDAIQSAVKGQMKTASLVNPEMPHCVYYAYPIDQERIVLREEQFAQTLANTSASAKKLVRFLNRTCSVE